LRATTAVEWSSATSLDLDRGEAAALLRDEEALRAERERSAGRIRPHLLVRANIDGVRVTGRAEEQEIVVAMLVFTSGNLSGGTHSQTSEPSPSLCASS